MKKLKLEELGLLPLSASHLNRFIGERPIWLLRKFYGLQSPYNLNMMRGHVVEHAVELTLKNQYKKGFVEKYYIKLSKDNNFTKEDKFDLLKVGLEEMVDEACTELIKYGKLISAQDWLKFNIDVSIQGETYSIPFTGRTDFFMESADGNRVLVDLKTTSRMPSFVPHSTKLQQVLYARATNYRTDLLYVGYGKRDGAKSKVFEVENDANKLKQVQQTIIAMEELLRITDDKEKLKRIILPNPDDWSWNDKHAWKMRKEVWGW